MIFAADPVSVQQIQPMRERYRLEMACQIIHDSLHSRPGWTRSYFLTMNGKTAGYGAIAVAGPWTNTPTVIEFYILEEYRAHLFDFFDALLNASKPVKIETQSNDPLLTIMLHTFAQNIISESILFHDKITSTLALPGADVRLITPADAPQLAAKDLDSSAQWLLEFEGAPVATGGILFHYNRPYGDIYMGVAKAFQRRGFGAYLVQELKRICYEQGSVPAARCNTGNIASRKTLQKAGFVPCGHILVGACAGDNA